MPSETSPSRIVKLANTIALSVDRIGKTLSAKGIASPSFNEDSSFNIPLDLCPDHDAVLDATAELHDLLLEPLNLIHRHGGHNNSLCLQAIAEFKIADLVPPNGNMSFEDIASRTPMTGEMTARLLRHAMTMRIFCEPEPGMVAHTASSKILHFSPANDWLQAGTTEMWPAATKMVEALQRWAASQEVYETGYMLANNGTGTIYETFANGVEKASRWARGMETFTKRPQFNLSYVIDHYDWGSLGQAQVVDIGGSRGHVSLALAKHFSNLSMTVQDMQSVIENATVPHHLLARVKFMAHDLFSPQPVRGADVYYMRWIMHNWSDKYCLLILQALIPALRYGAKIVIQETLMSEPGTLPLCREKNLRATDLNMAAAFNGKERTVAEFKSLFERCNPAFVLRRVIEPLGSALGLLEFVWENPSIMES